MLCVLLCLLMATVLPAGGEESEGGTEYKSGDYTYTLDSSGGAVISYTAVRTLSQTFLFHLL
jgi:hypothetical protein